MKKQKTTPKPVLRAEAKKILTLVNKAIMSTSLRDKNEILAEFRDLWVVDNEKLEALQQSNSIKQNELQNRRKQQTDLQQSMETLKTNTSFFKFFNQNAEKHNQQKIIQSIKEKEEIITKFQSLGRPTILQETMNSDLLPVQKTFTLIDLNLRRAEEIVHAFQKRLNNVEQSQESTETVLKEFGSVSNLLTVLNALQDENKGLKKDEAVFLNDAFVRRRRFTELTPSIIRLFISIYRTLLDSSLSRLPEFQSFQKDPEDDKRPNFDDLCADTPFVADPADIDIAELGKTLETENNDHFTNPESPKEKLKLLKEINALTRKLNNKLETDIDRSIKTTVRTQVDSNPTRIEKLKMENERILDLVHTLEKKLDNLLLDNSNLVNQVTRTILAQRFVASNYTRLLQDYHNLTDSHILLKKRQVHNKSSLVANLSICSSFGNELMFSNTGSPIRSNLAEKFLKEEESIRALNPIPEVIVEEKLPEQSEEKPSEIHDPKMLMMQMLKKKKKHSSFHSREASNLSTCRTESESIVDEALKASTHPPEPAFFKNSSRAEVLDGLAMAFQLGGFTFNSDRKFYKAVHSSLNNLLKEMSSKCHELVDSFEKDMTAQLAQIGFIGNKILVKEKQQIAIQTIVMIQPDVETQTAQVGIATRPKRK